LNQRWVWLFAPIGLVVALAATLAVFRLPIGESMSLLYEGALGDKYGVHRTIVKSCPLILVALGLLVAWRAGVFNIGGEGQLLAGAIAGGTANSLLSGLPAPLLTCAVLAASIMGGALYAALAGWMFAKRGVNIVISTILLNFVAVHAVSYAVRGPLQEPTRAIPQSATIAPEAMFARIDVTTDLHWGVAAAPVAAVLLWVYLSATASGFRLRLVGSNAMAARAARIDPVQVQVRAIALSGGLCGLAGGVELLGVSGYLFDGFSPGWGFLGIPVALLGGLHPLGVIPAGAYFGALFAGTKNLEAFGAGKTALIYVLQGVGVLAFVALQELVRRRREDVAPA
jgi:simple sugar transport system permease protein